MRDARKRAPGPVEWEESLLAMDTEVLLSLSRNYVGAVRSPWDKRTIVARLVSFMRKEETVEAIGALFDPLDVSIVTTLHLTGPLEEAELRGLFGGEVRAFDLGVRLANLEDRLVLFRSREGRRLLFALNPYLAELVAPLAADARLVLGGASGGMAEEEEISTDAAPVLVAEAAGEGFGESLSLPSATIALFSFLFHSPSSVRKDGTLTRKAMAKLEAVIPEAARESERYEALLRSFVETGILAKAEGEGGYDPDAGALEELLRLHGDGLPLRLALSLSSHRNGDERSAAILADAISALPPGIELPETGLARWLGIVAARAGVDFETADLAQALARLGIVERRPPRFVVSSGALRSTRSAAREEIPSIVADGAHLLRVLPEAGLAARWFAARIARPQRLGLVWEMELDRETVREAFASGMTAKGIKSELGKLGGRALPQSLAFSLDSWEGEFLSTRLFHGWVLVCDERRRAIIEGRPDLASLVRERLAPGVYLLDADDLEEVGASLAASGLEVPPAIKPHGHGKADASPAFAEGDVSFSGVAEEVDVGDAPAPSASLAVSADAPPRRFDPSPRLETLKAHLASRLAAVGEDALERERMREIADRIEARLIVDAGQIDRADVTPAKTEAGGLDYGGKVRLAERAMASPGDRLEIRYQLPGGDPETVILRPVRLQKTERGIVLEGENLDAGTPLRVPLGAASMVRRLRATPFGVER